MIFAGAFFVFMVTPWFREIEAIPLAVLFLRILGGTLGVVGVPATMILWGGMAIYCVAEDRCPLGTKVSWFILFFLAGPFGSVAYYFFVYRKQVLAGAAYAPHGPDV